jgi:ribosomal protein S4
MKRLRYRFKLYRRLLLDVWGLVANSNFKLNKLTGLLYSKFLVRSGARVSEKMRRFFWLSRSSVSFQPRYRKFLSLYLLRLFYFGINRRFFNRLLVLAGKREGFLVENFLVLLEFRLSSVLYRGFFFFDLVRMKQILQSLFVFVNRRQIS